ncbi:MAG: extensin family protein, partial [Bauldia sp.]|nr:extensin family protein [Bauldia sp.]
AMLRRVAYLTVVAGLCTLVGGCALNIVGFERRDSWREQAERACMARKPQQSYFIHQVKAIDGKGVCGITYPLDVQALEGGTIGVGPDATLGCPITTALEIWMRYSVQPASFVYFGMPIVEIKQISAYACRTRNNKKGAELSEHAFGNAIDIAGFKLANGRVITVKSGWNGSADERAFLREIYSSATRTFKTVLGPGAAYHSDHFHVDLARHNKDGTYTYAKPKAPMVPPARRPFVGTQYAAIPGQPRYGIATGYTGSIAAPDQIVITDQPPTYTGSAFFPADYDPSAIAGKYNPPDPADVIAGKASISDSPNLSAFSDGD